MEEENKKSSVAGGTPNKVLETYAEDMARVIENDTGGLVKKIIHGEEQHEEERKNLSPESRKNKFFMLISLLLVLAAFSTLLFFSLQEKINTVEVEEQFQPLIFNDQNNFIEVADLKKDQIAQVVLNEVKTSEVKKGGVEGVYLTYRKKLVGLRDFITLIKGNFIPGSRSFVSDSFLLGVVGGENNNFFILLKVRSIPDVFDALRAWENKMFLDLHGFFGVELSPDTKYLLTKNFSDIIVGNKNTRVLYDQENKIVLMYVLADDNSVIVTNSEEAAYEIMLRLTSSRVKK